MARKKRKGMPRQPRSRRARAASANACAVVSYEITSEPLSELPENKLPPYLAAAIERLYYHVQSHPRDAIVRAESLDRALSRLSQTL